MFNKDLFLIYRNAYPFRIIFAHKAPSHPRRIVAFMFRPTRPIAIVTWCMTTPSLSSRLSAISSRLSAIISRLSAIFPGLSAILLGLSAQIKSVSPNLCPLFKYSMAHHSNSNYITNKKNPIDKDRVLRLCAEGGTRTLTLLRILDFESSASTNFTTSASII